MTTTPDTTEPRRHLDQPQELTFKTDPERGPITAKYAANLIYTVLAERPDWTFQDVAAALDDCRGESVPDLRRAVFAVAEQPGSTPDQIARTGAHWNAAPIPEPEPTPAIPSRQDPKNCPRHPYRLREECEDPDCVPGKGRGADFWEKWKAAKEEADRERERVAAADRAAIELALRHDRERLGNLGQREPRHV